MNMHPAPFFDDVAEGPDNGTAHWLETADGVRIRIGHWRAEEEKGTILLFPGRTEYIEKYGRTAAALGQRGYAVLAIDWRGQGLADRLTHDKERGYVEKFDDYQLDLAATMQAAEQLNLPKPYYLLAHSMGGAIGLRAVMSGLPVRAAVFTAPMWGIQMTAMERPTAWALSWASKRTGLGLTLAPKTTARTYVLVAPFEGNTLTRDADMYRYMQDQVRAHPELELGGPAMHWLHEALTDMKELAARPAPDLPCVTYLGDQEQIVEPQAIIDRMANWPGGELVMIEGAEHEVLMELPEVREMIHDRTAAFFDAHR